MNAYDRMIHAFAAARHALALRHETADAAFARGDRIDWRRGADWRQGEILACGHGRRLFVGDCETGTAHWIAFDRLRSRDWPDLEVVQEVALIERRRAFGFLADMEGARHVRT